MAGKKWAAEGKTDRLTRQTNSPLYVKAVKEVSEYLMDMGYPKPVVDTVWHMLLSKDLEKSPEIVAAAFDGLIPDEARLGGNKGMEYYGIRRGQHPKKTNVEIYQPEKTDLKKLLGSFDDKIITILGIDSGEEIYLSKYAAKHINGIIDSREGEQEDKMNGVVMANHMMDALEKFQVIYDTQQGNLVKNKVVKEFALNFLKPLMDQKPSGQHTIATHSFGSAFIDAAQGIIVDEYKKEGLSDKDIEGKFSNFRIIQFGYPAIPLEKRQIRIKTYALVGENDLMPPERALYKAKRKDGDMVGEFQILTDPINPERRTAILNKSLFPGGSNVGGHALNAYVTAGFGENAPKELKNFLKGILNLDPQIRNGKHISEFPEFEDKLRPYQLQETMKLQTLFSMGRTYADQLVAEILPELNAKNIKLENIKEGDVSHPLIKNLGFIGKMFGAANVR